MHRQRKKAEGNKFVVPQLNETDWRWCEKSLAQSQYPAWWFCGVKRIGACRVELISRLKWPLPPTSTLTMLATRKVAKRCFETAQRAASMALFRPTQRSVEFQTRQVEKEDRRQERSRLRAFCVRQKQRMVRCLNMFLELSTRSMSVLGDRGGEGQQESCSRWSVLNKIQNRILPQK
jgi:hypothetical protein